MTEQDIDVLARHLPVLRVIAGESSAGPAVVDGRTQRLHELKVWRARVEDFSWADRALLGHINGEIVRIEAALKPPVRAPLLPKTIDERGPRALHAYLHDDLTLKQIGEQLELTRERVRQLIAAYDPTLYALARRRRHARNRLRQFVRRGAPDIGGCCVICGVVFERGGTNRRTFCTPEHRVVWERFAYHINPERHAMMRAAMARRTLETGVGSVQHATNVLNGECDQKRWMQEGSTNFEWALKAYRLQWPLFDNLPAEIQDQIRDYAEHGPRPRKQPIPNSQKPRNVIRRRLLAGEEISGTVVARELGVVTGVFSSLQKDMVAEGYRFIKRKQGLLVFSRLDPSCLPEADAS